MLTPVPSSIEVVIQGPGKLPGVGVKPALAARSKAVSRTGVFGAEPGHGLPVVGEVFGCHAGSGWRNGDPDSEGSSSRAAVWAVCR
jgi:hypothetical protein